MTRGGSVPEQDGRSEREAAWQEKRYRAASYVQDGMSLRAAAAEIGDVSHQFVRIWAERLLEEGPPDADGNRTMVLREGHEDLVRSRRPGPAPGKCSKVDEVFERVKEEKGKPFRKNIGARKIKAMSGVDASVETVAKALERAEYGPVSARPVPHTMRTCAAVPNMQWDIDFVEIGRDADTGRKVYSLSVEDDHSR